MELDIDRVPAEFINDVFAYDIEIRMHKRYELHRIRLYPAKSYFRHTLKAWSF